MLIYLSKIEKADRVKEAIEGQIIPEIRAIIKTKCRSILQEKINEIVHIVSDGFKQKLQQKIDENFGIFTKRKYKFR